MGVMTSAQLSGRHTRQSQITKKAQLKHDLPHMFGWGWYNWNRAFFESRNKMCLLVAANQIGKSTIQIRKHIHWATDTSTWAELWPKNPKPRQFWYLYPTSDIATTEFQNKWVPEIMPKRGNFINERGKERCDDPVYGWRAIYDKKKIYAIEWASGVMTYFKTYSQNVHSLQAGSCHYISTDEELPEDLYDELVFRLKATGGYFSMVFTATRNQMLWMLALEGEGELEKFPRAFKQQIAMKDCLEYEDGTPGHYTQEMIDDAIADCKNQTEVERRVEGRFVTEIGRKYGAFVPSRHFIKPFDIPRDWKYYGGVDIGSGGAGGHPSAMGIIAVAPDYRSGVVCRGWRGDNIETTAGDTLDWYIIMRGSIKCTLQLYDQACKDFHTIATRVGEAFNKSEKSHEVGENIVNTLFKNDMLKVFDTPELRKLGAEFMTLSKATAKRHAKDDLIDGAVRYPCTSIPWDWSAIRNEPSEKAKEAMEEAKRMKPLTEKEFQEEQIRLRRGEVKKIGREDQGWGEMYDEIGFWNGQY